MDERKILIYPRQNIGLATSILHVRRFAVEDNSLWSPAIKIRPN